MDSFYANQKSQKFFTLDISKENLRGFLNHCKPSRVILAVLYQGRISGTSQRLYARIIKILVIP